MRFLKTVVLYLSFLLPSLHAAAQFFPGMAFSNYGGITTISSDPCIADSKFVADISLGAFSYNFSNNFVKIPDGNIFTKASFKSYLNADPFRDQLYSAAILNSSTALTGASNHFFIGSQMQGPGSFLVSFGKKNKNAIAVSYHLNVVKNIDLTGTGLNAVSNYSNSISVKTMAWADYGVTYSRVLYDKDQHFLKAGVTMKLLQGLGATYIRAYGVNVNGSTVTIEPDTVSSPTVGAGIENMHTNGNYYDNDAFNFNYSYAKPSVGFDLGAQYEWRPKKAKYEYEMDGQKWYEPQKNLYTIATGFSVVDMGAINFNASSASGIYQLPSGGSFNLNPITGTGAIDQFLESNASHSPVSSFKMLLPTRFNVFIAGNAVNGLGGSISSTICPAFRDMQVHYVTNVILTPHYETPWLGVYLPASYDVNKNFDLGLALRLGPITFGVQNLTGLATGGPKNSAIYAAVKIPLYRTKPKDSDGDHVSDKFDKCPTEMGTWATMGCADKDGDGIPDKEDSCPTVAGLIQFHGCPDTDGDGIPDAQDSCPTIPGIALFHGCPDTDGDGIPDKADSCPTVAGLAKFHGCPDSDGDGVPDYLDHCPTVVGDLYHHGCPDTDGDGVYDDEDSCKLAKGPRENNGCPWPDRDADGVPDKDDKCPDDAGSPQHHGCPDTDEDGVYDDEDSCRFLKGPASNHGCPEIVMNKHIDTKELIEVLNYESNKAELGIHNKQLLDNVYDQWTGYTGLFSIRIIAYTDDQEMGDSTMRVELSKERAENVKKYLLNKGVSEENFMPLEAEGDYPNPDQLVFTPKERREHKAVQIYFHIVGK